MGAGQIGGIATLLDIEFNNAAGFLGVKAEETEGQYMMHYLPNSMMFCVGVLIEAHIVLTVANCVYGERHKFEVIGGTHKFLEFAGTRRMVQDICIHRGYNHSNRFTECSLDNLALMVLDKHISFNKLEPGADYVMNRARYGAESPNDRSRCGDPTCRYYGWGSRRNGFLIPLLINLYRMDVRLLPKEKCLPTWNKDNRFLCVQQPPCRSEQFGALCPDDVGSVIVCSGYIQGMMTSSLVDRPCGVGFIDLLHYSKFLTCGVDDSRDVVDHDPLITIDLTTERTPLSVVTRPPKPSTTHRPKHKPNITFGPKTSKKTSEKTRLT